MTKQNKVTDQMENVTGGAIDESLPQYSAFIQELKRIREWAIRDNMSLTSPPPIHEITDAYHKCFNIGPIQWWEKEELIEKYYFLGPAPADYKAY